MLEAVRTTASTFEIWVIVVVAMGLLAFWLSAIFTADRIQVRASGQSRESAEKELASDNAWAVPEGDIPTRADLPVQPPGRHEVPAQPTGPAQPAGRPAMPAQRTGDADRAERSYAGPLPPDEDETGH